MIIKISAVLTFEFYPQSSGPCRLGVKRGRLRVQVLDWCERNIIQLKGTNPFDLRPLNTCRRVLYHYAFKDSCTSRLWRSWYLEVITSHDRNPDYTALKPTKIAPLVTVSLHMEVTSLDITSLLNSVGLTLILLTWRIWWASNNASKWQMGFNLAFKRLMTGLLAERPRSVCLICSKHKRLSPVHSLQTDCRT